MKKHRYLWIPVCCLLVTVLIFRTVFLLGYVPSESMEPTLKKDSLILGLRLYGELGRGDIIIFWHEDRLLVKRIAAVPGDVVEANSGAVVVPRDCYYVLGDNAENSFDSRYWDDPFISKEQIYGKLIGKRQSCKLKIARSMVGPYWHILNAGCSHSTTMLDSNRAR